LPYPKNIEKKLEFDQIKELTRQRCLSVIGQEYLDKIRFVNRFDVLQRLLSQVNEFKIILTEDNNFPNENYFDLSPSFAKVRLQGMWLAEEELFRLKLSLVTFLNIARFFKDRTLKYPELEKLLEGHIYNDLIIRIVDRILDAEGKLKPNATPEYYKLHSKINEKELEVRRKINRIFEKASGLEYLADGIGVSLRDGRLVLPVLAEHKRHVHGFVHDESHTGQTVFIEPAECFELNNELRELQIALRREKERILLDVTNQIRPHLPEIERNIQRMGLYDFIRAKALVAISMKASLPIILAGQELKLYRAFHPLLKLNHDKNSQTTVPLDIELNKENRVIVISGPNAGGKSVCLKTVGLLQYMHQCGFLIPCESHSEIGTFKEIFVDIGDEQSIENDLSTYSSHLLHMKYFTDFANSKSLFLIDEFGMGTDPQFGGPLAEAILQFLNNKNAFGVVTTHFTNLKNFASETKGIVNACMLFDHENMRPLFVLEIGKPGSSYAFEIAVKTGLNNSVINYAKSKVGVKQKRVDELLVELEKEKKDVFELRYKLNEKESKLEKLTDDYQKKAEEFSVKRKQLLLEAKLESLAIVSEANSRVEAVIREIKEKQADSESQKTARTYIKEQVSELKEFVKQEEKSSKNTKHETRDEIVVGSNVKVEGQLVAGEVLEIKRNKALVAFGDLRTTVELNKLILLGVSKSENVSGHFGKGVDLRLKMKDFQTDLNVIGMRGDVALSEVEQYIDDSYLLGVKQVRIIHGRGLGILKKLIRENLKKNNLVVSIADESFEFGGDAITVVTLKN